jgi:tRNA (mo5U34)-methyltransferase
VATTANKNLADDVAQLNWYHSIDLGDGLVTPGWFDLRPTRDAVPLPRSLAGRRCLDVGTWDGYWAFEMERRGADSVLAIDIDDPERWDWPASRQRERVAGGRNIVDRFKGDARPFDVAKRALGSSVERVDMSVYDVSSERIGEFDLVFIGSLLLHLRDPVGALMRLHSVCRGEAVIADTIDVIPSLLRRRTPTARLEAVARPWWWLPNVAGLERMVASAGFDVVERSGIYFVRFGASKPQPPLERPWRSLLTPRGREEYISRLRRGIPHAAVRARPIA